MEECVAFGIEAGFIQGEELEDVQKMLVALRRGVKPPPCKGKQACDEYCSNPNNMEICMNFALEAGFMSEEEKEGAHKMLQALKKGVKPPACRGREECDVYCAEESHFEECMKFAEAAGFMSPEEAEMARKTGGKGPGGCKSKEECQNFCNNPNNQETCFNFAKENGMIPEEDLQKMEQVKQQFKEMIQNAPPEVYSCLESAVGAETMAKLKSGEMMPPKEMGDKMGSCFGEYRPQGPGPEGNAPGAGGSMPPAGGAPGTTGPGGCTSQEECQNYCASNPEACKNFQSPPPPGSDSGPGSGFVPCEGENCSPPPGDEQYRPPRIEYPTEPGQPIPSSSGEPTQPLLPGSTAPGSGGEMQPGVFVPQFEDESTLPRSTKGEVPQFLSNEYQNFSFLSLK